MSDFTVLTDEQAAHDAATSKRYLEALRELQAENADLKATEEGAKIAFGDVVDQKHALTKRCESLEASIAAMRDIISTQASRIAALEKDAARYRFLQAATWNIENVSGPNKPDAQWSVSFYSKYGTTPNENEPDRAIDAAIGGA